MKTLNTNSPPGFFGKLTATIVLLSVLAVTGPVAHAAVSGNATVFNEATVSYTSGASTGITASADESVTVDTLGAQPTVAVSATTATTVTADVVYTYTIRSNANGEDTYTQSVASVDGGGIGASGDVLAPAAPFNLWGGIVLSSGAGTINLPGGSTTGLANGDTVEIGAGNTYTVTITTAGNAESSGTPEVEAVLTLTPIAGPIIASDVAAGTQIGEYATMTLTQTPGTPVVGTDGTHTNNVTLASTATDLAGAAVSYTTSAGDSNETVTTVSSPSVTIVKEARNLNDAVPTWVTDGSTTAKPGAVIEYRITVTNTHASASVSAVYVDDTVPTYATINTGVYNGNTDDVTVTFNDSSVPSSTTTGHDHSATVDQADLAGSVLTMTGGSGAGDASVPTGGTLDAGDSAVFVFQVTVN